MDKMYFDSAKNLIYSFKIPKKVYKYRDFANFRLIGIIISSFILAYAGISKSLTTAMIAASIFAIFHFYIYVDIYFRERD
jgi:hypothetical protein